MAINLTTKYSDKVAERFKKNSLTTGVSNQDYSFEGIKTLKIFSVDTVPLNDYTRSGTSRYGTPAELGDTTQELTMTQDKAFTYTIDKGNEKEQLNIKAATTSLRREIDEVVIPTLDKYRFNKWCNGAGTVKSMSTAPAKTTITGLIMDSTEVLDDAFVPETGRTLFIKSAMYKLLKENPDFLAVDKLAESSLVKGQVGEIDGMKVVKVPNSYFPDGVYWMITHKSAIMAPAKLQDYKVHKDPPGINGDLVEGRVMHDAFVLGTKSKAVYVAVASANVTAEPTCTYATGNCTIASTTSGATIKYTVDGTDPKNSTSAVTYSAPFEVAAGILVRAYAEKSDLLTSGIVDYTVA